MSNRGLVLAILVGLVCAWFGVTARMLVDHERQIMALCTEVGLDCDAVVGGRP